MLNRTAVLIAAIAALDGCVSPRITPAANAIAIVGVTVVDPSSAQPATPDQTILISEGVIRAVGPSSTVMIPSSARRVDARGKYAIPGLWDAHVHFMNTGVTALPLLVANGVTSVRETGGHIDSTRAWQARMRNGSLVGPRIVTAGPILESPRYLQGVVEGRARAQYQHPRGGGPNPGRV
jgi:imidazolonepropionase-like amidohydrolase